MISVFKFRVTEEVTYDCLLVWYFRVKTCCSQFSINGTIIKVELQELRKRRDLKSSIRMWVDITYSLSCIHNWFYLLLTIWYISNKQEHFTFIIIMSGVDCFYINKKCFHINKWLHCRLLDQVRIWFMRRRMLHLWREMWKISMDWSRNMHMRWD